MDLFQIMEYFVLMSSLLILFCGLMFTIPIDKFPSDAFRKAIDVIALFIAITSTVFVISMGMLFVVFNLLVVTTNSLITTHSLAKQFCGI